MQVGEVIALLCKYACNDDTCLMQRSIYSIDVEDNGIHLHFVDANTQDYTIETENMNDQI